ncbi:MAG: glyceraldehyde 3-phosphate dehydrogenase NAD-binding domain-containing protein [Acidobacteriota bacterium]
MAVPFAINGFGRIGRAVARLARGRSDVRLVALNDPAPVAVLADRLKYDSVRGPYAGKVTVRAADLELDGHPVAVFRSDRPADVPWSRSTARIVLECSGQFLDRESAAGHLGNGVERVVWSANSPQADVTLCRSINEGAYDPRRHRLISNASCTTHCLAPLLRVLEQVAGIEHGAMTSVHSYTPSQELLDASQASGRRARAAGLNLVPLATTAPRAIDELIPSLAGKISGLVVRVPSPAGAWLEVVARVQRETTTEALRAAFRKAATSAPLAGVLGVCEEELVSSDFVGSPESAIVDLSTTAVTDGRLVRVAAWYDNEWGYAHRLIELVAALGEQAS